ncbi:MAG TPA: hypothetical protein VKA15_06720, partial [Isosphaeraceae bacterium]|nr:hypothetical protein [Isosphaeraceae bacterium]
MNVTPSIPVKPTSAQYCQADHGSPVGVTGTGVGTVVVVPAAVVVVVDVVQAAAVMVSSSRLTWPLRANTRPSTVTPVVTDAEVNARILPTKVLPVPKVAELPTCQNTLHA